MTAQRKVETAFAPATGLTAGAMSLHDGAVTGAFTSSLGPVASADAGLGEGLEMFTSSLSPSVTADTAAGDAVQMFTSSLAPRVTSGDAVGAFTSSLVRADEAREGDAVEMFTSSL